ncbi:ABC transporter domain-containing protein [Trichoderma breve]|uniref:ABC transporter domain-containing protein n=1 Tax=Trichoderma breve TaxID=2034170 RepID=A0A9W9ECQ7_9HYPO|nr:ABC transporter domain-containing protein [Trichoderma breve]KAJ4864305.1 ABC transporter domain-containing protein [Trichoderma breve]
MDLASNWTTDAALGCDNSFGPAASSCETPRFDFTLLFEQSILSIAPCALLLIFSLPRTLYLFRSKPKVLRNRIGIPKLLSLLVVWSVHHEALTRASLAAATLSLADGIALSVLSFLEHRRSIRPSSIILVYLVFSIAFDAVQCRTLWLLKTNVLAPVSTATLACKIVVFLLELGEKRHILLHPWNNLTPETTSSIINRSLFWWLNDLLLRGFRTPLSTDTLYEIDDSMKSERLFLKLQDARQKWSKSQVPHRYRLLFATCDSLRKPLAVTILPRLFLIGFKFAQPFLINRVITYIQEKNDGDGARKDVGYALVGATGLVYLGSAISNGFYQHKLFRSLTMIRGALTSLVYIRTLEVSAMSSDTAAITLSGPDVTSITRAFESFHEIWANPIEIALAIWLLARELGLGCIGPAVAVIVCTIAMTRLSNFMGPAMKAWNEAIQQRITTTSSVIGSIKEVKMLGRASSWTDSIQLLRVAELQRSKKFRRFITYMNILGNTPSALAPILTFGIAIAVSRNGAQNQLSISTAFTSLSIIALITNPLAKLLSSVPSFVSCIGSFERIEAFVDESQNAPSTPIGRRSDASIQTGVADDVSFNVKRGEAPVLQGLTISIRPSTLTLVTGKIGSGKSMLLLGLMGELHASGNLKLPSSGIAFCSQATWLVNTTIKQNITGPEDQDIDSEWYETVIRACALERDLQQLRDGDESIVGSKGLTLSGGQKQRVALARAIYSRKQVLIADDIFSGLDPESRRHIWTQVFGPLGILRRQKSTVILATHTLEFIQDADHIIILENGRIEHQGTFSELCDSVAILKSQQGKEDDSTSEDSSDEIEQKLPNVRRQETEAEETENLTQRMGDSSLYAYYFRSIGWKLALGALFFSTTEQFLAQFAQIWLKWWTEANEGHSDTNTGMYYGVYAMFLCLGVVAIGVDCWFMFVVLIPRSAEWLHWQLLEATMKAPMAFFNSVDSGDLINRFSQDMSLVDRELPTAVYTTTFGLLSCIGDAIIIIVGAKYLAATLPVAILVLYALQKFYLRTSRQLRVLDLQAKSPLNTQLLETIEGLSTIRAFHWQSAMTKSSLGLLDRSQRPHYLLLSIQRWLNLVLDLLVTVAAVLLVLFGVTTKTSTPGNMAIAMYSALGFSGSLANFISSWTSLETSLGAIARLKEFMQVTPQEIEPSQDTLLKPSASWPSSGQINWQNIEAYYTRKDGGGDPVLHNISLQIQPGQKVAICGRSGSGKSSLLSTLFGLLDYSGTITIDGLDISQLSKQALRSGLIVVPQHPVLFPGSLRSNLLYDSDQQGQMLSDTEIIALLEKLEVWDAVCQSGSLDTDMTDLALSYGQKQLLCLARAILRKDKSRIVILDEAMSAVDHHTEELMIKALETEFNEHTIVSIVHRLNTVRKFDALVVLDQGKIVEMGIPGELITESGQLKRFQNSRKV